MPLLTIHGFGEGMIDRRPDEHLRREDLRYLRENLREAVASIAELELTDRDSTVLFPADLCGSDATQNHVVCVVSGMFETEKRTPEVRMRLAEALLVPLKTFASRFARNATMIEVLIEPPFRPQGGFAKWVRT